MNVCVRHAELVGTVRAGQWPLGCAAELREHVAACTQCAEEVRLLSAFATAREGAMRMATQHSPELLWWKAQLRRRREVMERLERPGFAISTATLATSLVLLTAVLLTAWKQFEWARLSAMYSHTGWSIWTVVMLAVLFCSLVVVAVLTGLPEERG